MHTPRNKSLLELESNKRTLIQLNDRYPGRESQIDRVAQSLGTTHATNGPLFIYGPPSSGKTSIILDFLKLSSIPHAYINCHETNRTKAILTSVLHQLKGNKRKRNEGYNTSIKCDNINDFLVALPSAVSNNNKNSNPRAPCIVLDTVDRIATSHGDLLIALTRIPIATRVKIHIILISTLPWGTGKFHLDGQRILPPIQIHFPAYKVEHLAKILLRHQPLHIKNSPFAAQYKPFIQSIVPAFSRTTNSLLDIQIACDRLWPKYIAPLQQQHNDNTTATTTTTRGGQVQGSVLLARIRQDMQKMISELEVGSSITMMQQCGDDTTDNNNRTTTGNNNSSSGNTSNTTSVDKNSSIKSLIQNNNNNNTTTTMNTTTMNTSDSKASSYGLSFELPYMSKFLLLAAYIASRNKATADRAVFDPGYSRRGRKDAQAHDKQTEAAIEAALRGPHSFPLERLLHIFYCIYEQHGPSSDFDDTTTHTTTMNTSHQQQSLLMDENEEALQLKRRLWREVQCAEVHMQLSTLVALRLLSRASSDVLEGGVYKCNISDDVARAIATNVKMRLGDYLKLA